MTELRKLEDCETHRSLHLGKFDDCLAEALWTVSMYDGDSTGSTDFGVHVTSVRFDEDDLVEVDEGLSSWTILVPAGIYHVMENDRGQVTVAKYDLSRDDLADAEFDRISTAYAEWEDSE